MTPKEIVRAARQLAREAKVEVDRQLSEERSGSGGFGGLSAYTLALKRCEAALRQAARHPDRTADARRTLREAADLADDARHKLACFSNCFPPQARATRAALADAEQRLGEILLEGLR
jgi:hypothetical protein